MSRHAEKLGTISIVRAVDLIRYQFNINIQEDIRSTEADKTDIQRHNSHTDITGMQTCRQTQADIQSHKM